MTDPNAQVVNYTYDAGLDTSISRLSSVGSSGVAIEVYDYLGLGTVIKRQHSGTSQPAVTLSYLKLAAEGVGDAGDQYTGLDRFGRVVDQRWLKPADLVSPNRDRYQYTYDRDSNRLTRNNVINTAFNETYTYDGLNQLATFAVTGTTKSWDYDAIGNWDGVTTNSVVQSRTHNKQNELLTATGQTSPTYDANGNQKKDFTNLNYTYDAWNRVIGASTRVYEYDGLGRRIQQVVGATTTNYFQDAGWQTVEDRTGSTVAAQYVWSAGYVDEMVVRDLSGVRLWVTQDANYNVTGLLINTGVVQERYTYDPYGSRTMYDASYNVRATSSYSWVFGHQGLRLDTVTGKYYARNRDYDPVEGRWMSLDPLGFGAGDVDWYRGLGNSPSNAHDPRGLQPDAPPVTDEVIEGKAGDISAAISDGRMKPVAEVMGKTFSAPAKGSKEGTIEFTFEKAYAGRYTVQSPAQKKARIVGEDSTGVYVKIVMKASKEVDRKKLRVIQFEAHTKGGLIYEYPGLTARQRKLAGWDGGSGEPFAGWRIDQLNNSPLVDTKGGAAITGVGGNPATIWDTPTFPTAKVAGLGKMYVTTLLCDNGKTMVPLASVSWGWDADKAGIVTMQPVLATTGAPAGKLGSAALGRWKSIMKTPTTVDLD